VQLHEVGQCGQLHRTIERVRHECPDPAEVAAWRAAETLPEAKNGPLAGSGRSSPGSATRPPSTGSATSIATTTLVLTTPGDPPAKGEVTVLDLTVRTSRGPGSVMQVRRDGPHARILPGA